MKLNPTTSKRPLTALASSQPSKKLTIRRNTIRVLSKRNLQVNFGPTSTCTQPPAC